MLASEQLIVTHVITHVSMRKAIELVKRERIERIIEATARAVATLKPNPRIAVAGLNPHAGENGLFGREEIEEIQPAVAWARSQGLPVEGPFPPDTVFYLAVERKRFDAVVCMYHDQGHIPLKLLDFEGGVNVDARPADRSHVGRPRDGVRHRLAGRGIHAKALWRPWKWRPSWLERKARMQIDPYNQPGWRISRRTFLKAAAGSLAANSLYSARSPLRFGVVTDVHYADRPRAGTRYYRLGLSKLAAVVNLMNSEGVGFLVELGDFKDEDVNPSEEGTLAFLRSIERNLPALSRAALSRARQSRHGQHHQRAVPVHRRQHGNRSRPHVVFL